MRTPQVILLSALVAIPTFAQADEACVWKDPGKPPRTFVDDHVVFFREYYSSQWAACAMRKGARDVEVQWLSGADADAPPLHVEKAQISVARGDGPTKLEARLFPSVSCGEHRTNKEPKKFATTGLPGREQVVELVPLRVRVKAAGALTPLEFTSPPIEVPCNACDSGHSGAVRVVVADNQGLVLEATLDPVWFECARRGATLSLLAFAGDTQREALAAVQPDLVVPDLEKEFVRKGDAYVLRKPLPMGRMCTKKGRLWAFELWGRGELMHAGGGGRDIQEVKCK
jgi:hypothetical protein